MFQLTIKDAPGKLRAVTLAGHISNDNIEQVETLVMQEIEAGFSHIVIDLSDVAYISSGGLKMLVTLWKRAHDAKGDIVLAGLQPPVREVFTLIGFDLVFTIFDSVEVAHTGH